MAGVFSPPSFRCFPGRLRLAAIAGIILLLLSGCFVRRRVIATPVRRLNRPPLATTEEDLVRRIHAVSDPIQAFLIRTTISPSVEAESQGIVTDYATINGYILFQRPNEIRVIGQDPVMNRTIFDMASSGHEFRIHIPSKKRFVVGDNEAPPASSNKLENLRPSAFLTALMIAPPDAQSDILLLEDRTEEARPRYTLLVVRRDPEHFRLVRSISFDAYTLQITAQRTFDSAGRITTAAVYASWKSFDGIPFPSEIEIRRPQERYEVQLRVLSMKMNPSTVTPETFVLEPPPGTSLQRLP